MDNSTQFSEAEKLEAHLLMCVSLLSLLVNETKAAVTASYGCVQNTALSPNHTCSANHAQSMCSTTGVLLLDSLPERFTSEACARIFFEQTKNTLTGLETVEGQLRKCFSIEETPTVNGTTALIVSQQGMVVLCHSAFPYESESLESETSKNDSRLLRLCENTCHRLYNTLNVSANVHDPGKSP